MIAKWIVTLTGILGVIGILPFIIIGIVYLVKYSDKNVEEAKKKSYRNKGIFFLVLSPILIVGSLIVTIILTVVEAWLSGGASF